MKILPRGTWAQAFNGSRQHQSILGLSQSWPEELSYATPYYPIPILSFSIPTLSFPTLASIHSYPKPFLS